MNDLAAPHSAGASEVIRLLNSSEQGLSPDNATRRKLKVGENRLPMAPPAPAWRRFLSQFHNVLIYVLLISATLSALLQHFVDSGVIFAVVLVNALVGFLQEGKAEDALRAITSLTQTHCMVVREGVLTSIDSIELVPGDVIILQAGDRVPADVRLFYVKDLRCDESALTGEAQPVTKHTLTLDINTSLADRKNMAYMGTMVTYGLARGIVTATGLNTQIGEISRLVKKVRLSPTPLQQQLAHFARQLTLGIVVISAITMLLGIYMHGYSAKEMFQAAVGIAVSSIPEGLPAIVTIALAIGVQRMAKSNALIRRLPAVEVLGSVDIICSDKTGTLTANEMTVREIFTVTDRYRVDGEGYKPEGAIASTENRQAVPQGSPFCLTQLCTVALLCNDASLTRQDDLWVLHGDPTEGALLTLAMKQGMNRELITRDWPRIDILPFESERCYMATLHHNAEGQVRLMIKGAPEKLLSYAQFQWGQEGTEALDLERWQQAVKNYAQKGMRVLALAIKDFPHRPDALSHQDVEKGLVLVGLTGINDPPRPEAIESIRLCHDAGIRVKMITGDNPVTAAAIGKELGLDTSHVMTGQEIDRLTTEQLAEVAESTEIFARTSPANKLQLVTALQMKQHVVAMTGDGVNDAPALKKASIGVAMGRKGTDAAKEAADFVLTDDNFSTIARAVSEGRTVYDNIVKSIVFILPTNLAEALVIFTAVISGRMMPITPAQILWVNMITAVTLALALAFERSERDIMQKPPRPFGQSLFSAALLGRMVLVGGIGAFVVFTLFYYYRTHGASIEFARTIAVSGLVMIEVFYLFNCRFLKHPLFNRDFLTGTRPIVIATLSIIVIQLGFVYLPVSQRIFGLESISVGDWLIIILAALPVLLIVEIEKALRRGGTNLMNKLKFLE